MSADAPGPPPHGADGADGAESADRPVGAESADGAAASAPPAAPPTAPSSQRNLALLWSAQLVSVLGDACFHGAIPLVVKAMPWIPPERQGRALAVVFAVGTLPFLLFAAPFGALFDRLDRRRVMVLADLARAAVAAALGLALLGAPGEVGLAALAAAAFLLSTGSALFNPARDALIPELVEPRRLFAANALVQTAHQLGPVLGWVAALVVIDVLGRAHLFTLDGVTYLVSAALLVGVRAGAGLAAGGSAAERLPPPPRPPFLEDLRRGLADTWADRPVRALLALTFCNNLFIMGPALVAAAALINVEWRLSDRHYLGFEATFACGMLLGTGLGLWLRRFFRRSRILLWALVWDGLTYVAFEWIGSYPLALVAIFLHAAAVPLIVVCRASLLQEIVEPRYYGRTFALIGLTVTGAMALSLALTGLGVDRFGARAMFFVGGLGGAVSGAVGLSLRSLRGLR